MCVSFYENMFNIITDSFREPRNLCYVCAILIDGTYIYRENKLPVSILWNNHLDPGSPK